MAGKERVTGGSSEGPATDASNTPVVDPTQNVLDLVRAAIQRQDDLRSSESSHVREIIGLRAEYESALREAESKRIDAIRAVDVAAVQRAAEVAAEAVQTLAAQVPITAEAVRTSLAAALNPILNDIAELRKVQYEQQGQKQASTETKASNQITFGQLISMAGILIAAATALVIAFH